MHYDIIMNVYECQVLKVHEIHEMLNLSNPDTAVIFTTRWSIRKSNQARDVQREAESCSCGQGIWDQERSWNFQKLLQELSSCFLFNFASLFQAPTEHSSMSFCSSPT